MKRKVNSKYKDRLFLMLFGSVEEKSNIVSLYNAVNNTDYNEEDIVDIMTLEDVVYIKMKNDVSLLIDGNLTLWEQQSTINPNMPIRGLMYFGNLYNEYIDINELNIYGSKLIKIPTPKYVVFYNGTKDVADVVKLKLSDAFIHKTEANEFEWTATMYNLNKNNELLSKCKALSDYMTLIKYIRGNQNSGMQIEEAVDEAIVRCINENVMSEYLKKHRGQVMDVCITEYNEKVFVNGIHEEGREEGRKEGLKEGREEGLKILVLSLMEFIDDENKILASVRKNEIYKNVTLEEIKKYM